MGQVTQMMNVWLQHRGIVEEIIEKLDDKHIDFKPWDGAMTLGELALHIAGSGDMFVSMVKTEEFAVPDLPSCQTAADIRQALKNSTQKTKAAYENISDEELEQENHASHPKLKGTKKKYLDVMFEHEIHHKGQLFLYARMVGVKELPFFR